MKKDDCISRNRCTYDIVVKEAQAAVDCVFLTISSALQKNDTITLTGFGTFKVAQKNAGKGRNPRTGQKMTIKAKKGPQVCTGEGIEGCRKLVSIEIGFLEPSLGTA